ncbi:MAG: VanW family protein [Patescibacteria group bacterium]|nr:VanW family protein [Patescibacteria group bacterium]
MIIKKPKIWRKVLIIFVVSALGIAIFIFGGLVVYAKIYEGKIYPGVSVGKYQLGGMTKKDAQNFVESINDRLAKEGINFLLKRDNENDVEFSVSTLITDGETFEIVRLDSENLADAAYSAGRGENYWNDFIEPIRLRFFSPLRLNAEVEIDKTQFAGILKIYLAPFETYANNANIVVTSTEPLEYFIEPEKSGYFFSYERIIEQAKKSLAELSLSFIDITREVFIPSVTAKDLEPVSENLDGILSYGDLSLNFIDPITRARKDWILTTEIYTKWLENIKNERKEIIFGLNEEKTLAYLESLKSEIETQERDAKFMMEEGKAKEFQASRIGVKMNKEQTYADLDKAFQERNFRPAQATKTVSVVFDTIEPKIKLADINDLGITDIIGSGTSTFRDSHTNRIKNIANAVKRLNGVLIKPGENFSTTKYAGPFTLENGFLPEEVIKGKEIKKEVGGGMCQIGTTLFRMAMNSAMPIVERRNHSLVVNYYADPINGNPGTDATVYEPLVDFKFLNDTGNYLLLQTDIDYKKQMLTFTLWGKPDGRAGWYSRPLVSRWISAGEPQDIIVDNLKPGEKKCQNAFRGAVASFTYTRVTPTGEKIEKVFDSYYRPLPKTCFIGKEETPVCEEGKECVIEEEDKLSQE